jgi:hypothetical protein
MVGYFAAALCCVSANADRMVEKRVSRTEE